MFGHGYDFKNLAVAGIVIVCIVLAINAGSKSTVISPTAQGIVNTISVSGSHEMSVEPDKAELYIAVETTKKTAKEAQLENAELTNAVRNELVATKKVSEDDIETYSFNLYEKYEWDEFARKNILVGYTVSHMLKVVTYDIEGTGDLIDKVINEGANRVDRVTFSLKDETQQQYYAQSLQEAAKNAESKAKTLASSLKVNLGKISRVSESTVSYIPYDYYPRAASLEMAADKSETVISPQEVRVSANVQIDYEIS